MSKSAPQRPSQVVALDRIERMQSLGTHERFRPELVDVFIGIRSQLAEPGCLYPDMISFPS